MDSTTLTIEETKVLRNALDESRALSRQTEKLLKARADDADSLATANADLEKRLTEMEEAYAKLLGDKMGEAGGDAEDLKLQMQQLMGNVKQRGEAGELSLKQLLDERERENARLSAVVEEYKNSSSSLKVIFLKGLM
jgi:myosin heavy subunit